MPPFTAKRSSEPTACTSVRRPCSNVKSSRGTQSETRDPPTGLHFGDCLTFATAVARTRSNFRNAGPGSGRYHGPMNTFRITGLDPGPFQSLFGKSDEQLAALGARRCVVDQKPGFPDRIEMRDLELGETALLVNYTHLDDASSPYRSSHAVYVREGATAAYDAVDEIPEVLRSRLLSVRAFDTRTMMVAADVIDGNDLRGWIASAFENGAVTFIDVHNAKPGCFAARVRRA